MSAVQASLESPADTGSLKTIRFCDDRPLEPRLGVSGRATVVARSFGSLERKSNFRFGPRTSIRIRYKSDRLGRKMWQRLDWGRMVREGVRKAHQLFRDASRLLCTADFRKGHGRPGEPLEFQKKLPSTAATLGPREQLKLISPPGWSGVAGVWTGIQILFQPM
ncbi:hypothetical protein NDU88_000569 [Pleurodeles waltl]|uniref:Uncharacterized protein n=1 Tax=Pleurodeles waltl TaxID=8319 RepID=A0AAV7S7C3_PLEWA|nr:hypothetical protein NDU88_000569 [Pleurodeles waltl]